MKILIVISDVGMQVFNGVPGNNTVEEMLGVYLALETKGHEPFLMVNPGIDAFPYRFVNRGNFDVNDFDQVIINREEPNFFGGEMNQYTEWTLKNLPTFRGQLAFFFCDPEMIKGNYFRKAHRKMYSGEIKTLTKDGVFVTKEDMEKIVPEKVLFDAISRTDKKNMKVWTAYPILDHPIHDRFKGSDIEFIDSWREHLFNVREKNQSRKLFDVDFSDMIKSPCYVGTNKPSRHRRLIELGLFNEEAEKNEEIFFYGNIATFKNVKAKNRINLDEVQNVHESHMGTLVIGNFHQNDTGINHRYLQGLIAPRIMMVDRTCDPNLRYLFDKSLADDIYFSDREDYLKKLTALKDESKFYEVVEKLQEEKRKITGLNYEEFVRKVSE